MTVPRVQLRPKREKPFLARHPWVFAGAIETIPEHAVDGSEVEVVSATGQFVARGLLNRRSKIQVRLYSWTPERPLDDDFFREKLKQAISFRHDILGLGGKRQACRLVFSEGDGLSGWTVDRFGEFVVMQFTSLAMAQRRERLADLLQELLQPRGIYVRTERGIGLMEGLELQDGLLRGELPPDDWTIEDAGITYRVNLTEGQKTGFYLDQRDNRVAAARYACGRTVLDAFCYSGGFGLQAALAGANSVEAVDVSQPALQLARENAQLNGLTNLEFVQADVFRHLETLVQQKRRFGMVILDPPKFARTKKAIPEAMRGYRRLQTLALRLLEPGGFLVMCCCSGSISMEMLDELLAQTAVSTKREVQLLQRLGQAPDHPIALACPETAYLKCLIGRIF